MKHFFRKLSSWCVMAGLLLLAGGCYDDSEIWKKLEDHERRIQALEQLCSQMNTNIASMQNILTALQNSDFVTDVTAIKENGVEIGYTITFSKSGAVTIYHGKDGKDGKDGTDGKDGADGANGKDGSTPVVGLQQDEDGVWYWTLNGEWLLDAQGAKVKAVGSDGKDGVTPQLKIEAGYWYISYDEGQTWTYVGQATGNNGKDGTNGKDGKDGVDGKDGKDGTSFFKSVTQDFDYVYLTLANGTVITMPKFLPLSITFSNTADTLEVTKQQLLKINYHFQASTDKYHIEAITSSDIACILSVPVVTEDKGIYYGEGILSIQVGDFVDAFSRVTVFFSDERTLLMRKYAFKKRKAE